MKSQNAVPQYLGIELGTSVKDWLPDMDSNHDKQIQKLLCYHYTIRQMRHQINHFAICVKQA